MGAKVPLTSIVNSIKEVRGGQDPLLQQGHRKVRERIARALQSSKRYRSDSTALMAQERLSPGVCSDNIQKQVPRTMNCTTFLLSPSIYTQHDRRLEWLPSLRGIRERCRGFTDLLPCVYLLELTEKAWLSESLRDTRPRETLGVCENCA
jgi:hypothetical protein